MELILSTTTNRQQTPEERDVAAYQTIIKWQIISQNTNLADHVHPSKDIEGA